MEISNNYNVNFGIRLGTNLKSALLKNDFHGSKQNLTEFEDTFQSKFNEWIDPNSILEMNSKGRFELSHPIFPKYKISFKLISKGDSLSEKMLNAMFVNYNTTECNLFKKIISQEIAKGKTLDEIEAIATQGLSSKRIEYFDDYIEFARRIKQENPNSKLTDLEFSEMSDRRIREILADTSNGILERLGGK